MSNWKIILPIGTITLNQIVNPSFETGVTGWTTGGTNTIARSTDQAWRGAAAALVTYQDNTTLASYAITFLNASTAHKLTAMVYVPANWDGGDIRWNVIGFAGASTTNVQTWTASDGTAKWVELEMTLTLAADNIGTIFIDTTGAPTAGRTVYLDAFSAYEGDTLYTYWDGDTEGASWLGADHASISKATEVSRNIGEVADLRDTLNAGVREVNGAGAAQPIVSIDSYSLLAGGTLNNIKDSERAFTLIAVIRDFQPAPTCDLNALRQAIISEIVHDAYPPNNLGWQPVTVRYTGATVTKEARCHYEGGLEAAFQLQNVEHEIAPIRWRCPIPYWYDIADSHAVLDTNDTDAFRYVAGRQTQGTRQWEDLGLGADPDTNGTIYAIHYASDGTVYFGGDFEGMDGAAGRDYIANYDPVTGNWATVGGASDINGIVYDITEQPNGDIVVVGAFTDAGAVAAADYITTWDGSSWAAVGIPVAGAAAITSVRVVRVLKNGDILVGGDFDNFANIANADNIAQWNGSAWNSPGAVAGADDVVYALAQRNNGNLYAGGLFANIGGVAAVRIAEFDGSAWAAMGSGLSGVSNTVWSLDYDGQRDIVYIAGQFTNSGGTITLNNCAFWDNQTYRALGDGLDAVAYVVKVAFDGVVYFGGNFTTAGNIADLPDKIARYSGGNSGLWSQVDVDTPATNIYDIAFGQLDPVRKNNYNVYIGFDTTGAAVKAGLTTITNPGNKPAYPKYTIGRTGGTTATVSTLRNETTAQELIFDYDLLDGEQLIIEMSQTIKSITSNYFGEVPGALLAGDLGSWYLQGGDNVVTALVITTGAPTITAQMVWRAPYDGFD